MPVFTANSASNWLLSLKVLLISTGVLSVAVVLKLSVPLIFEFTISGVPILYSSMISWLRPPYLYILINCIIIGIVASSKLHPRSDKEDKSPPPEIVSHTPHPTKVPTDYTVLDDAVSSGYSYLIPPPKIEDVMAVETERMYALPLGEVRVPERKTATINGVDTPSKEERASPPLLRNDSMDFLSNCSDKENEKPPVSARFANRKALKCSPEGKGLRRVSKPKRQETLESTWRTITEGRAMPLTRHLKKSDTLDSHARLSPGQNDPKPGPMMRKSETFHERRNEASPGSGKLKREASLSQDELNRRVEAFIKKFNEEMRLQRQESLNQYQEMMGRGAH